MNTMINQIKTRSKPGLLTFGLLFLFGISSVQAATIGYWRLEDGTAGDVVTSTADSSGNGYAATQWGPNTSAVKYSSKVAGAYIYDPVTGTYSANTGSMLATGSTSTDNSQLLVDNKSAMSGSFTVEMFMKIEDGSGGAADLRAGAFVRLLQMDGDESMNSHVGKAGDGTTTFLQYRLGSTITDYSPNFEDGNWHHLAYVATYNGTDTTTMSMYVDGAKLPDDITYTGQFIAETWRDFRFGLANSNSSDFDWFVDEVRISDTALSSTDFLQVSAIPEPGSVMLLGLGFLVLLFGLRKYR